MPLALVLHAHQPAGNFDSVIEHNYQTSYLPFIEAAAERERLRLNVHFSGFLLDWLAERHPEYIAQLRRLAANGRLELLGGGYYEPILASIPARDQQAQLAKLTQTVTRHFGVRPRGAWLAERVWEPQLAAVLASADIEYTLLDDSHFQAAGLAADDLHGYWLTESAGHNLAVIPSNYFLRQAIPFRPEAEALEFLQRHPERLVTMGDDLEKFGSWPSTFEHVYGGGWLRRFFEGLDLVPTVLLSEWRTQHPPRGLVYLPTASYPEMMQWAGNPNWSGFFTKYRESNLLHKSMLDISRRLTDQSGGAYEHLLAAQANDVYWHGWFGGVYSPHLRNIAFTHLLAAEAALPPPPAVRDLHSDGGEVVELRNDQLRVLIDPADGGTIEEFDVPPRHANLLNSIRRRAEAYHDQPDPNPAHLPRAAAATGAAPPDRYDRCERATGRIFLAEPAAKFDDYRDLRLAPVTGRFRRTDTGGDRIELEGDGCARTYTLAGGQLEMRVQAIADGNARVLEATFNLLAPDADDRYFEQAGQRFSLRFAGALGPDALTLHDGWREVDVRLEAPGARAWWVAPIYTRSQSEQGLEEIYQGSGFAAVWEAGTTTLSMVIKIFL
ncbi:MAG TPA: alpha-amylase/4-alpha-glucanotransferase domain-containing protein [Terriglobales bacterium]|nr:alpha-amylase/4-alpha-glucanotransferase domain-containing protein [Terriglobales bacterium]